VLCSAVGSLVKSSRLNSPVTSLGATISLMVFSIDAFESSLPIKSPVVEKSKLNPSSVTSGTATFATSACFVGSFFKKSKSLRLAT
jgi:hypothetical protein